MIKIDFTATTATLENVLTWHREQITFLEHQPEKHQDPASLNRSAFICGEITKELMRRYQ